MPIISRGLVSQTRKCIKRGSRKSIRLSGVYSGGESLHRQQKPAAGCRHDLRKGNRHRERSEQRDFSVIDEYGVTQPSGLVTVQANGNYSFTLSMPATQNGSDKDGHLYTIVVRAFDQAGHSATATATLRIN